MAKEILYPVVKETTYYPEDWYEEKLRGEKWHVKGSLYGYMPNNVGVGNSELVENRVFEDTLTYVGYSRGRSSAVMNFKGSGGEEYDMFMSEMDRLIKMKDIVNKQVTGKWTFCKRGQNYSIRLVE